jgi:uncharacterized damage-inducible protein DinB
MIETEPGFRLSLDALIQYSDNCRRLLRETLMASRPVFDRPIQPAPARFLTIRQIAAHMIGAEEFWIRHRINGEDITRYETRSASSIERLFEDWESVRRGTKEYIARLNPTEYQRVYRVTVGELSLEVAAEQVLFHIMNHETHHRSQISFALQQFKTDPPDFDFVLLK